MSTSSLTSAHLHTFSHIFSPFSLSRLLYLSLFRREQGQWQRDATKRNPFARNEVRSSKTEEKLRFQVVPRNPFARNEVRSSKTEVKLRFQVVNPFARNEVRSSKIAISTGPIATLSHEMRFDRQKLRKNCDFQGPIATLSHEMRFDRQKLRKNCNFKVSSKCLRVKASVCKSVCV